MVLSGRETLIYMQLCRQPLLIHGYPWSRTNATLSLKARSFNPCKRAVFPTRMHLSWSGLIILCGRRSHSTAAAALLHGGSTSGAIIGRRGSAAQLTVLIPGSRSSAGLFKSLPCRSYSLLVKQTEISFHA